MQRNVQLSDAWVSSARQSIPREVQLWLIDTSSLSKRLRRHFRQPIEVQVLKQQVALPSHTERTLLQLRFRQFVWIREVCIRVKHLVLVDARTIVPVFQLRGRMRQIKLLGNRALGDFLFRQANMHREIIEMTQLTSHTPLKDYGRRSIFTVDKTQILLSERLSSKIWSP